MVDLDVHLQPAPSHTIAGDLGYGTGQGALIEATWTDRNFFNSGRRADTARDRRDDASSLPESSFAAPISFSATSVLNAAVHRLAPEVRRL